MSTNQHFQQGAKWSMVFGHTLSDLNISCSNQVTISVVNGGETCFFMCFLPKLGPAKAGPFFSTNTLAVTGVGDGYTSGLTGLFCLKVPYRNCPDCSEVMP
jgi:hypothetical protein